MSNVNKFQQATSFLMFSALSEVLLCMYDNTTFLKHYDSGLHTKLKNLRVNFERVSARAFKMFPEDEQLIFMKMVDIFEKLIESSKDQKNFMELMGLIESWERGEVTMINTKEKLMEVADEIKKDESASHKYLFDSNRKSNSSDES